MSQRGLEWALRLRADIGGRIMELREALAGIEPLRQELARLEGQLAGVERLVAVYNEQLGYPRREEETTQAAFPRMEEARAIDAALVPLLAPSPGLIAILFGEARSAIAKLRKGASRFWLSVSGRFLRGHS